MFDVLPQALVDFVDTIFGPPRTFLEMVLQYLNSISLVAGRGINLSNYLSVFGYLPPAFQLVINSLLAAVVFLAILQLVKVIIANFYTIKEALFRWL